MVEKKTVKNNKTIKKSGRNSKIKANKLKGGGADDNNILFTIEYDEFVAGRINLKSVKADDGSMNTTIKNNTEGVKSVYESLPSKTFLSFKIKKTQEGGSIEETRRKRLKEVEKDIIKGKKQFIQERATENYELVTDIFETEQVGNIQFTLKEDKKTKKITMSIKQFVEFFNKIRFSPFPDEIINNLIEFVSSTEESEESENKILFNEILLLRKNFLEKLNNKEITNDSNSVKNLIKSIELQNVYEDLKQITSNVETQILLINFFFGMFECRNVELLLPNEQSNAVKILLIKKINQQLKSKPEPENLEGGGLEKTIKEYVEYLDSRLGPKNLDRLPFVDNNKIHDLEIFKYLYNFLIYDETKVDLMIRKQMKRIMIFFRDKFTTLRKYFLFYLCAFSRERYDILINFFKSKSGRMKYLNFSLNSGKQISNFKAEIKKSVPTPPTDLNNPDNDYINACFNEFFPSNDPIVKELGMYSLFYQGEVQDDSEVLTEIFNDMNTSNSANTHYKYFTEMSPADFFDKFGENDKVRLKEYFFYTSDSEKKELKIAIKANISVSETKIFAFNLEEFKEVGGIREGLFKLLDENSDSISFKSGILNNKNRIKFFYEVNEIVNHYRFFKCFNWMVIKLSSMVALHSYVAASATVEAVGAVEGVTEGADSGVKVAAEALGMTAKDVAVATETAAGIGPDVAIPTEATVDAVSTIGTEEIPPPPSSVIPGVYAIAGIFGGFTGLLSFALYTNRLDETNEKQTANNNSNNTINTFNGGGSSISDYIKNSLGFVKRHKESLYKYDGFIFTEPFSAGKLKSKNSLNSYNLYLELKNFDVTYCNNINCGTLAKGAKGLGAVVTKLSNKASDIPCLFFTISRLNYIKSQIKQINLEIDEEVSIKDFKDEPEPIPDSTTAKSNSNSNSKSEALSVLGPLLSGIGKASFLGSFQ